MRNYEKPEPARLDPLCPRALDYVQYARRRALRLQDEGDSVGSRAIHDVINELLEARKKIAEFERLDSERDLIDWQNQQHDHFAEETGGD